MADTKLCWLKIAKTREDVKELENAGIRHFERPIEQDKNVCCLYPLSTLEQQSE